MTSTFAHSHGPVDASGFRYFSAGETGEAHDLSHRLLDQGRFEEGYRRLGAWLETHDGTGSEWVHIHWHMAVFEIETGRVEDAHRRFRERILPIVARGKALTDAPSMLWRLRFGGGADFDLEWGEVRDAAAEHLGSDDPYVELHNLLALAGARDVVAIDRWLDKRYDTATSESDRYLLKMAWGLRTFATGDWEPSATLLDDVERVGDLGGSRAQNELFEDFRESAEENGEKGWSTAA